MSMSSRPIPAYGLAYPTWFTLECFTKHQPERSCGQASSGGVAPVDDLGARASMSMGASSATIPNRGSLSIVDNSVVACSIPYKADEKSDADWRT